MLCSTVEATCSRASGIEITVTYPANIERVKRLCERIIVEQDPQSFYSLVQELNRVLMEEEDLNRAQKQRRN